MSQFTMENHVKKPEVYLLCEQFPHDKIEYLEFRVYEIYTMPTFHCLDAAEKDSSILPGWD
jgi:hypothetical protein